MLDEQQMMTVIVSAKRHFSIPIEPLEPRRAGKPRRSLYHSLFSAAIVNVARKYTDLSLGRMARTKDEIRPVTNKRCIKRSKKRSEARIVRVFTLKKIGAMAGIPNHSTVKYHFSQHQENTKLEAYQQFCEYMESVADEIIFQQQGA